MRQVLGLGLRWLILGLGLRCAGAWGQQGSGRPVAGLSGTDAGAALEAMAGQAGVIFVGHVVRIARNDAAGFVEIRFAVDESVLNCAGAGEYSVREWAGLWVGRAPRYGLGQRFLMLLHAPGAAGLSAPVGGLDGAIPLVASGAAAVLDGSGKVAADTGAAASLAVDLKWVQARALRGTSGSGSAGARAALSAVGGPVTVAAGSGELGSGTTVPLGSVLAALRGGALANR